MYLMYLSLEAAVQQSEDHTELSAFSKAMSDILGLIYGRVFQTLFISLSSPYAASFISTH